MKKVGHMMYPRTKTAKTEKYTCCVCGKSLTPDKAFFDVDGNNYAITQSAEPYCAECARGRG